MGYPRHRRSRDFKFFTRSAGNLTMNSTSWADLPSITTTWDISLVAQAGDVIRVEITGLWGAEAVEGNLDVVSIVSAAPVNYWGGDGNGSSNGVGGWYGPASAYSSFGGSVRRVLVSGDIASGVVTMRPRYRTATASNKTLFANTNSSLHFAVDNLGPQDPN